MRNKTSNVRIT